MFTGAINAFIVDDIGDDVGDATGTTKNLDTGETGEVQAVARQYKADGKRWLVVGDTNYGEGSSREHAAMSPRLLGAAAVIVRGFARIHETNLKKQGVLPLTFSDPADYDKVQEEDRVSIVGLADLAPGVPITMKLAHADGLRGQLRGHAIRRSEAGRRSARAARGRGDRFGGSGRSGGFPPHMGSRGACAGKSPRSRSALEICSRPRFAFAVIAVGLT